MTSDSVETCFMLMHCNFKTGPFHTYPFLFENGHLCSLFSEKSAPVQCVVYFLFARLHEKAKVTENGTIFGGSMHIYWYLSP